MNKNNHHKVPEKMSLANYLTIFRILLIPFFVWSIISYQKGNAYFRFLALGIFSLGVLTDAADGYFARFFRQKTQLGSVLDPLADKMLLLSAFLCLSILKKLPGIVSLPFWVAIIFISRDVLILLGAGIIQLFSGNLKITPTTLGKFTTFFQMLCVISILLRIPFAPRIWELAALFTVISGLDYLRIGTKLLSGTYPA